jgi:hypothetical protein
MYHNVRHEPAFDDLESIYSDIAADNEESATRSLTV